MERVRTNLGGESAYLEILAYVERGLQQKTRVCSHVGGEFRVIII